MILQCCKCKIKSEKGKNIVRSISCMHDYCKDCMIDLFINKNGFCSICLSNKITYKDIIPFLKKTDLFDNNQSYSKRILLLNNYFKDNISVVKNNYFTGNKVYKKYSNLNFSLTFENFLKVMNSLYIIYEDFDFIKNDEHELSLEINNFIVYYQESKIAFVYKRVKYIDSYYFGGFKFHEIIFNITKEQMNKKFLKTSNNYNKFAINNKLSNIMNPDGYTICPYPKVLEKYIKNNSFYNFQNYKWIHFIDMEKLEKYYFTILMTLSRKKSVNDTNKIILSYIPFLQN